MATDKQVSPKSGTLKSLSKGFDTSVISKTYYNLVRKHYFRAFQLHFYLYLIYNFSATIVSIKMLMSDGFIDACLVICAWLSGLPYVSHVPWEGLSPQKCDQSGTMWARKKHSVSHRAVLLYICAFTGLEYFFPVIYNNLYNLIFCRFYRTF